MNDCEHPFPRCGRTGLASTLGPGRVISQVLILLVLFSLGSVGSRLGFAEDNDEIACLKEECRRFEGEYKWTPAISAGERLLFLTTEKFGEEHPETFEAMSRLGRLVN